MKLGIIKERKSPPDRRVALTPEQIIRAREQFKGLEVIVESSDVRVFDDNSYSDLGIQVSQDLQQCDIIVGLKEIPVEFLLPNKTYVLFFAHYKEAST